MPERPGSDTPEGTVPDQVEIATAEWVDWYNHRRVHEAADDLTPIEAENHYYDRAQQPVGSSNR